MVDLPHITPAYLVAVARRLWEIEERRHQADKSMAWALRQIKHEDRRYLSWPEVNPYAHRN